MSNEKYCDECGGSLDSHCHKEEPAGGGQMIRIVIWVADRDEEQTVQRVLNEAEQEGEIDFGFDYTTEEVQER